MFPQQCFLVCGGLNAPVFNASINFMIDKQDSSGSELISDIKYDHQGKEVCRKNYIGCHVLISI